MSLPWKVEIVAYLSGSRALQVGLRTDEMRTKVESSVSPAGPDVLAGAMAFGPFRLRPAARRLERGGKVVRIGGRALDILIALAAQPGRVVSKAQLAEAAWPGMIVEEANLRFHIGVLRKALDEDLAEGSFITTVAGRGYCLSAPSAQQFVAHTANGLRPVDEAHDTVVGRDAQEAELANLLNQAAAGEAQLAFVTGDAGIGKSALAARVVQNAAAAGATAVIARCLPSNAATDAYYPMLDILMQLAGGHDDFAATISKIAPAWGFSCPSLPDGRRQGPGRISWVSRPTACRGSSARSWRSWSVSSCWSWWSKISIGPTKPRSTCSGRSPAGVSSRSC